MSTSGGTTGFASPQTTKGDLIGYTTTPVRLASGADGQVLTSRAAAAAGIDWEAAPMVNPMTTGGDLIYGGGIDINRTQTNNITSNGADAGGGYTTTPGPLGPNLMLDGNDATQFRFGGGNGANATINFGGPTTVTSVRILQANNIGTNGATTWTLYGSNDGTNFTAVATMTGGVVDQTLTFAPVTYQYFLIGGLAGISDRWVVYTWAMFNGAQGTPNRLGIGTNGQHLISNGAGLAPSWSDWGIVSAPTATANQGTFTTDVPLNNLSQSNLAFRAGRTYRLMGIAHFSSSVGGDTVHLQIRIDSNIAQQAESGALSATAGNVTTVVAWMLYAPGISTHNIALYAGRDSGLGNITMNASATTPAILAIEIVS